MESNIDTLYEYFEFHLFAVDLEDETEERFVLKVIETYISSLLDKGHIILEHSDEIRDDLQEEVYAMLRAKTYGYYSIGDFRRAVKTKKVNS